MLIPKEVFPIAKCCDTTTSRYALGGVRLERTEDGKALAVVTDGRRLMAVEWDDSIHREKFADWVFEDEPLEGWSALIAKCHWDEGYQMAKKNSRRVKGKQALDCVNVKEEPTPEDNGELMKTITLTVAASAKSMRQVSEYQLEGRFPKWRECVPNYNLLDNEQVEKHEQRDGRFTDHAVSIKLDAKMLAELSQLVNEAASVDDQGVELIVPLNNKKPVVLRASGSQEAQAILMPMAKDR